MLRQEFCFCVDADQDNGCHCIENAELRSWVSGTQNGTTDGYCDLPVQERAAGKSLRQGNAPSDLPIMNHN